MNKIHQYKVQKLLTLIAVSALSLASLAAPSKVPLIDGVSDITQVVKREVTDGLAFTGSLARDTTIFTIAGLALDAYVLTLPLEVGVKARVIKQVSNPLYAVPLGHFLNTFNTRYSTEGAIPLFAQHIKNTYSASEFPGLRHELFNWSDETSENKGQEKDLASLDRELIATFVTIYDALYSEDNFILQETVADQYEYLSNNNADKKLISRVQPLIISILKRLLKKLESGDIKDAVQGIVADSQSSKKNLVNNKAEAVTVTLIDFIRLNILKNYRQYELEKHRTLSFGKWMTSSFKNNPERLMDYLNKQNSRKYAVQITVDGLQGAYVKSLTMRKDSVSENPFMTAVVKDIANKNTLKPDNIQLFSPQHIPQHDYLGYLSSKQAVSSPEDPAYLPFFKWLYENHEQSIAQGGISSSPTISVRNLPLIWTGAAVAGDRATGVPNFHFVDRQKDRAYYFFGNDALQLDRLLAENKTRTMFDRLNYLKTLNCNAQYDWNAHVSFDGLVNLALGEASRDFGEQRCLRELEYRAGIERELKQDRIELVSEISDYESLTFWSPVALISKRLLIHRLIDDLAEKSEKGMPDYLLVYNPWPDHFAHFYGPFSDEVLSPSGELNRLDYWLGKLKSVYQYAGIDNKTLWGMAGDHGLTPVYYYLNPEDQVFKSLQEDLKAEIVISKISSDEGEGPKITNAISYPSNKGVDVVVASTAGGNYMMDFFHSDPGKWHKQPLYTDLVKWSPASMRGKESIDIINEVTRRLGNTLDYLVVRETDCDLSRCDVRLVAYRGGKRIDEIIRRRGNKVFYGSVNSITSEPGLLSLNELNPYRKQPSDAEKIVRKALYDLCVFKAKAEDVSTWCTDTQWRELAYYSPKPDSVNQMAHIYDEERAGTINLFPQQGIGYNTKVPGRHAGETFHEKDAFIGFWGQPVLSTRQLKNTANGSLAPTLFEYLTGEEVNVGENGWGFPSVLNHLVEPSN